MSRVLSGAVPALLLSFVSSLAVETQLTTENADQRPAWSPDGSTIVFDSIRSADRELWSIPAAGGAVTQLTTNVGVDWDADWSPSSTRIVFSAVVGGGNTDLYTMPATGGARVPLVESARFPSWSPDSTRIAYSNGDIWVIPAGGGSPSQLTTGSENDAHPTWSPDGTTIAFLSDRGASNDIWTIPAEGGAPVQITTDLGNDAAPDWSPDGTRIAFQSNRAGNNDIWVIGSGGGRVARLTTGGGNEVQPDWGPDGDIVFARGSNLWIFSFPSSDLAVTKTVDEPAPAEGDAVTFTVAVVNGGPDAAANVVVTDLLPTGVTYVSHTTTQGDYASETGEWEVGAMPPTKADTLTITATVDAGTEGETIENTASVGSLSIDDPNPANDQATATVTVRLQLYVREKPLTYGGSDRNPAWAPDGELVAFDSNRSGTRDLWVVAPRDRTPFSLNSNLDGSRDPSWSPNSTTLVFSGISAGGRLGVNANLYTIPVRRALDPTLVRRPSLLLADPSTDDTSPAWSPDGTMIAYAKGSDIYVVPTAGGPPTQLTMDAALDTHPTWSPDGSQIAFVSARSGNPDVWIIPAEGGTATQLTTDPAEDGAPEWSPTGNWIAFHSDRAGNFDIWVIPPAGGDPNRVTRDGASDVEPDWAPNGVQLAFSRDGDLWVAAIALVPPSPGVASAAGVRAGARQAWISSVAPNPGRRPRVRWDLGHAGRARLTIYDAAGRLVRNLVDNEMPTGAHTTSWDGRDRFGRPVPSGVYFARLQSDGWRDAAKLVIVR